MKPASVKAWTPEAVAERFKEAVQTGRMLPHARVQGYSNVWPVFVREEWERLASADRPPPKLPPNGKALDRMSEALRWVQWLDEDQRHVIWMRAQNRMWKDICARVGCDRITAWRRWRRALHHVADRLNAA